MKPKIKITIIKEDTGYNATALVNENFISTEAETFEHLKEMILEAVNTTFEDKNFVYTEDEIQFEYDLESFFAFYRVINAKALSQRIGMNQSLLAQYIKGIKKPSAAQTRRILKGVQQIGRELTEVQFLL
ncbi:hypothetical protein [Membranihabitans maritimus]|uniref:hypothetical protein n=1 Tax=Membranihabitans maritimus TaxID=2904244 RepID=UPI001F1E5B50|nr:hypothetical protein [Membranihabitans maritimus]